VLRHRAVSHASLLFPSAADRRYATARAEGRCSTVFVYRVRNIIEGVDMNRPRTLATFIMLFIACALPQALRAQGVVIPTDGSQADFLSAYRFALNQSSGDYRFTNATMDTMLFPRWGEFSVYWAKSGPNKGSFIFPDKMPGNYASVTAAPYTGYNWQNDDHYAIAFKANARTVTILKSSIMQNRSSVTWEAVYFKNLFESWLLPSIYSYINEREIDSAGLPWSTQLLVIPAFTVRETDWRFYIDSLFASTPRMKNNLISYLSRGGTIYTEGNGVYLIEKLGLLASGSVDYAQGLLPDPAKSTVTLDVTPSGNPMSFSEAAAGATIYAGTIPHVDVGSAEVVARVRDTNVPVVFMLHGPTAGNGRVICNTALPMVGGSNAMQSGSSTPDARQLQWVTNAIMYALAVNVNVTRSVFNDLPDSLAAGKNAASFDRSDTLEIRVKVRNLSGAAVSNITVTEYIRDFFRFAGVATPGVTSSFANSTLTLSGISVGPHSEQVIVYRIATPDPADAIHEKVNNYISWANYIYASYGVVNYTDDEGAVTYRLYRDYVDLMFSARLVADTDLNWKNFLGLYYQPFKVFMIMENKERTTASEAHYVQYIPKDVPFYWTDNTLNIPILKTPGGKYVDVLRGSTSEATPEYDMDHDGHPDAWLDTATIYPKGYTLEETEVYWLNPWEHLRSGNANLYEDIDHDGLRAQDLDGDGVVDVEEPGDKIRVWKVTWNIGKVSGYQAFDPYCSYEIWVDPPDLVPMSAGVGKVFGKLNEDVAGMFYPYAKDIGAADRTDTSWTHWMERDADGMVSWKQLVYQSIHNYEGFTFIDTLRSGYQLKGTDRCAGTVPQPHREFIAVLSLGGEEIDMTNPTPKRSLYSNIDYKTIFGETRNTPIRTTYTYYAPLPNPLQFEYLTNNFSIMDSTNTHPLQKLPAYGKANLTFDIDASTEYTYYWIRNAGHDVDYNDPSLAAEGVDKLGDGVFGYMLYDIPKGMGGYKITLPKNTDGSYDINKIVSIDGREFQKWLDNPHTQNAVQILEDPFTYHVYIPQLLIPPALDDDNSDGIDDWIDDRGDRFCSPSGFLHDPFMLDDGEKYPDWPKTPFKDDIYGMVTKGWYPGADNTYGDDFFENLGKTHVQIHALYEGSGKEGSVDISKGGWLVVEEIFGGSPWVIFSHALSGYAQGVNYRLTSQANPTIARYGTDTVCVKHTIEDVGEPHYFDINFDPYHVSYGYGETTITTTGGGKDPCSLISPAATMSTIIDPAFDRHTVTLLPNADPSNPDLAGYPKQVSGNLLEVRVEISNGTDNNWVNTQVTPTLPPELGATKLVMSYVAYPRPLVPAQVDPATGAVIHGGDDIGAFRAGWRFNQPEGEVLVKMGSRLNLMQPSRRGYFMFLFEVDPNLEKGIYSIPFTLSGQQRSYDGRFRQQCTYEVPPCMFSISTRDAKGNVREYQKLVIGQAQLNGISTAMQPPYLRGLERARWSMRDVNYTDFDTLRNTLPATYSAATGVETIDLSPVGAFPTVNGTRLYVLEQGEVNSFSSTERLDITRTETLQYTCEPLGAQTLGQKVLSVSTVGPKVILYKMISDVNGKPLKPATIRSFQPGEKKDVTVLFEMTNQGSSIAENVVLKAACGASFTPDPARLPANCTMTANTIEASCGSLMPGETRKASIHFIPSAAACGVAYDSSDVVVNMQAAYTGAYSVAGSYKRGVFTVPDPAAIDLPAYDVQVAELQVSPVSQCKGRTAVLQARCHNGATPMNQVRVDFLARINGGDTIVIASQTIERMEAGAEATVWAPFQVPDTTETIEFFATADPRNVYGEFCEFNNTQTITSPMLGPDWVLHPDCHPNPTDSRTMFSWQLTRDLRELNLTVHSFDGRQVGLIRGLPITMGAHSVEWVTGDIPAGLYIFTFEGTDQTGETRRYSGKVMKTQ
jgi:hypothetical protein